MLVKFKMHHFTRKCLMHSLSCVLLKFCNEKKNLERQCLLMSETKSNLNIQLLEPDKQNQSFAVRIS